MSEKQEMYYAITSTEDGEVYITNYTKTQLEKALNDRDFGEDPEFVQPCDSIPNFQYSQTVLIIKGEVVSPKVVEVVTKLELP